jgi:hypothetical protein
VRPPRSEQNKQASLASLHYHTGDEINIESHMTVGDYSLPTHPTAHWPSAEAAKHQHQHGRPHSPTSPTSNPSKEAKEAGDFSVGKDVTLDQYLTIHSYAHGGGHGGEGHAEQRGHAEPHTRRPLQSPMNDFLDTHERTFLRSSPVPTHDPIPIPFVSIPAIPLDLVISEKAMPGMAAVGESLCGREERGGQGGQGEREKSPAWPDFSLGGVIPLVEVPRVIPLVPPPKGLARASGGAQSLSLSALSAEHIQPIDIEEGPAAEEAAKGRVAVVPVSPQPDAVSVSVSASAVSVSSAERGERGEKPSRQERLRAKTFSPPQEGKLRKGSHTDPPPGPSAAESSAAAAPGSAAKAEGGGRGRGAGQSLQRLGGGGGGGGPGQAPLNALLLSAGAPPLLH